MKKYNVIYSDKSGENTTSTVVLADNLKSAKRNALFLKKDFKGMSKIERVYLAK